MTDQSKKSSGELTFGFDRSEVSLAHVLARETGLAANVREAALVLLARQAADRLFESWSEHPDQAEAYYAERWRRELFRINDFVIRGHHIELLLGPAEVGQVYFDPRILRVSQAAAVIVAEYRRDGDRVHVSFKGFAETAELSLPEKVPGAIAKTACRPMAELPRFLERLPPAAKRPPPARAWGREQSPEDLFKNMEFDEDIFTKVFFNREAGKEIIETLARGASAPGEAGTSVPKRLSVFLEMVVERVSEGLKLVASGGEMLVPSLAGGFDTRGKDEPSGRARVGVHSESEDGGPSLEVEVDWEPDRQAFLMRVSLLDPESERGLAAVPIVCKEGPVLFNGVTDLDGMVEFCGLPKGFYLVSIAAGPRAVWDVALELMA